MDVHGAASQEAEDHELRHAVEEVQIAAIGPHGTRYTSHIKVSQNRNAKGLRLQPMAAGPHNRLSTQRTEPALPGRSRTPMLDATASPRTSPLGVARQRQLPPYVGRQIIATIRPHFLIYIKDLRRGPGHNRIAGSSTLVNWLPVLPRRDRERRAMRRRFGTTNADCTMQATSDELD